MGVWNGGEGKWSRSARMTRLWRKGLLGCWVSDMCCLDLGSLYDLDCFLRLGVNPWPVL